MNAQDSAPITDPLPALQGTGILICARDRTGFINAWVCLNMLRHLECQLPVEVWHWGAAELDSRMSSLLATRGAVAVDAQTAIGEPTVTTLPDGSLDLHAIIHSRFAEVLLLSADTIPVTNPEFLFDTEEYKECGAIFWPGEVEEDSSLLQVGDSSIHVSDPAPIASGPMVIDKRRAWRALHRARSSEEQTPAASPVAVKTAWRELAQHFAMPETPPHCLSGAVCQHDFEGHRLFQQRSGDPWSLPENSKRICDFMYEEECLEFLKQLQELWDGRIKTERERLKEEGIVAQRFLYQRVGHDQREIAFLPNGRVGTGAGGCEVWWNLTAAEPGFVLEIGQSDTVTCQLRQNAAGAWEGQWLVHERMPVLLKPMPHIGSVTTATATISSPAPAKSLPATNSENVPIIPMTDEQKYVFDLKGWLLIPGILGEEELKELRADIYRLHAEHGDQPSVMGGPVIGAMQRLLDHPVAVGILNQILSYPLTESEECYGFRYDGGYSAIRKAGHDAFSPHGGGGLFQFATNSHVYQHVPGRIFSGLTRFVWELNEVRHGEGGTMFISGSHKSAFPRHSCTTDRSSSLYETYACPAGSLVVFTEGISHTGTKWTNADWDRLALFTCYNSISSKWFRDAVPLDVIEKMPPKRRTLFRGVWVGGYEDRAENKFFSQDNMFI